MELVPRDSRTVEVLPLAILAMNPVPASCTHVWEFPGCVNRRHSGVAQTMRIHPLDLVPIGIGAIVGFRPDEGR